MNNLRSYYMFSKALDREYSQLAPRADEELNRNPDGRVEML